MSMRRILLASTLLTLPACSAIVQPDSRRLGGEEDTGTRPSDAGQSDAEQSDARGADVGIGVDAANLDPDAFTPMGTDAGPECVGGCDDGLDCTAERCVAGRCQYVRIDGDGDGELSTECGGLDCDDRNADVSPAAREVCDDRVDNNCNGNINEGCVPPDTCERAETVDLSAGRASVSGSTMGLTANYRSRCLMAGASRPDVVYRIEVPVGSDVMIETTGGVDTVLAASRTCGSFDNWQCSDDQTATERNARLWLHNAPGTWFVLLTGFATGPYTINFVTTRTATDRCRADVLDVTAGGTVVGIPSEMRETSACGGASTRESTFVYNRGAFSRLEMVSPYRSFLSVRSPSCDSDDEQACDTGSASGGGFYASLTSEDWEAPLYIVADGGGEAPYAVRIQP